MRVFKEEQAFRQWWILLILGVPLIGTSLTIIEAYRNTGVITLEFLGFGIVFLLSFLVWILRLRTKIDAHGISARFDPISFFRKEFKWNEISKCYVREYSALTEYGGWGVRGFGRARAYNVSGNMGIQIITKDRKKFLIGTNKPEEAKKVIKRYLSV